MKTFVYRLLEPLGRLLARWGINPCTLTWFGAMAALISGVSFLMGAFVLGFVAAFISGLLDVLDGMVARLSNQSTSSGMALDSTLDRYSDFFLLGGLCLYYRFAPLMLGLGLLAILGSFMISYSSAKAEAMHLKITFDRMKRAERWVWILAGALLSIVADRWFYPFSPYLRMLKPPLSAALAIVAIVSNVSAAKRLRTVYKGA